MENNLSEEGKILFLLNHGWDMKAAEQEVFYFPQRADWQIQKIKEQLRNIKVEKNKNKKT